LHSSDTALPTCFRAPASRARQWRLRLRSSHVRLLPATLPLPPLPLPLYPRALPMHTLPSRSTHAHPCRLAAHPVQVRPRLPLQGSMQGGRQCSGRQGRCVHAPSARVLPSAILACLRTLPCTCKPSLVVRRAAPAAHGCSPLRLSPPPLPPPPPPSRPPPPALVAPPRPLCPTVTAACAVCGQARVCKCRRLQFGSWSHTLRTPS
jgi:hypothetical protein